MTKVKLYEKPLKSKKQRSLYLDYYPPIPHPITGRPTRREFLKIYVHEKPRSEKERELNKEARMKAEDIRASRQMAVNREDYSFLSGYDRSDLIAFTLSVAQLKASSASNLYTFKSVADHLSKYLNGRKMRVADVNEAFCRGFKSYLLAAPELGQNTASGYFSRFRWVVNQALRQKILRVDPFDVLDMIPTLETRREFLTIAELQKLAATPFDEYPILKRAALFSALTGLRFSDVDTLTWGDIFHDPDHGYFIRFKQEKTTYEETLPISDEAAELIGDKPNDAKGMGRVFEGLLYRHTEYLQFWIKRAGIDRRITFHAFRHTNATGLISAGVDLYTVSKLLGHKDIRTTQIYARVIDEKKREAAGKISLKANG